MEKTMKECEAVTIAVRQRPLTGEEEENNDEKVAIENLSENVLLLKNNDFVFDKIITQNQSQKEIYDDLIKPLVRKALDGFHCVVLAYGQTGTGKTYTMGFECDETEKEKIGIIPRALNEIFASSNLEDNNYVKVAVSFIEIYNERVYDLLSEDPSVQIYTRGQKYTGSTRVNVIENNAEAILRKGNKNRHVRPTKMNPNSSRSHAIFTIHLETLTTQTSLNLVDLAGSEGVRRTSHKGDALTEGVHINQGLLCIAKVVEALSQGSKVTPYRDSVLTSVLQDSLNQRSYLTLLACISPLQKDISETMSTLRFTKRAKTLKTTPEINAIILEHKKTKTPINLFKTPLPLNRPQTMKIPNMVTSTAFISGGAKRTLLPKPRVLTPANHKPDGSSQGHRFTTPFNKPNVQPKAHQLFRTNDTVNLSVIPKIGEDVNESLECTAIETYDPAIRPAPTSIANTNNEYIPMLATNTAPTMSYSPLVRRCVNEIGGVIGKMIEKKMQPLVEGFNSILYQQSMMESDKTVRRTLCPLPLAPQEIMQQNNVNPLSLISHVNGQQMESIASCSSDSSVFSFKRPATPQTVKPRSNEHTESTEVMRYETMLSNIENAEPLSFNLENESEETVKPKRRNTSIQLTSFYNIEANSIMNSTMKEDVPNRTNLRRSLRLSMRTTSTNSTASTQLDSTVSCNNSTVKSLISCNSTRRSTRLSFLHEEEKTAVSRPVAYSSTRTLSDITERSQNVQNIKINKKLQAAEKDIEKTSKAATKNGAKDAHKKFVLKILNTGELKDLQLLASIGMKTAFQIITYRRFEGKFKNIESLKKAPFWRGKGYTRFLEANNLN